MLTVLEIASTSLTISWSPPQEQLEEGSAISYFINVTDPMGNSVVNKVNGTILYIRVPELLPDHVYQVAVAAVLGEEVSPSVALFVRTSPVTGMYALYAMLHYAQYNYIQSKHIHITYYCMCMHGHHGRSAIR